MATRTPGVRYSSPTPGGWRGAVVGAIKGAQTMGKATNDAMSRRVKLNDALGKFRGK